MSERRPNRREASAAATRQVILHTARRLFTTNGYAGTSIAEIAAEAGVAVQTIYSSVGTKAALLLALNDLIDEEVGVGPAAAALMTETDPRRLIAGGVRLTRRLNEQCGDIVRLMLAAEPSDPEAAAAVADGLHRHRRGAAAIVHRLVTIKALSRGQTEERATAAFAMMTSPASWRSLTEEAGWSFDDAESWLIDSVSTLLLSR